jgi:hypothetical protein
MIWIILAALGVPLWLVVVALGTSLWSRKHFQRAPGVFKCSLRRISAASPEQETSWPRVPAYARWVHDVLIVHAGLALVRNEAIPVASVDRMGDSDTVPTPKRLGDHVSIIRLNLDDGSRVDLAAPSNVTAIQLGPFNVATAQPVEMRAN